MFKEAIRFIFNLILIRVKYFMIGLLIVLSITGMTMFYIEDKYLYSLLFAIVWILLLITIFIRKRK